MTEVEFSSLLSQLTTTAKTLNQKSDSINDVIKAFEEKLGAINLGLPVWLSDDPLSSEAIEEEDRDGKMYETGTIDDELGFTMWEHGDWRLAVRRATYRHDVDSFGRSNPVFKSEDQVTPLLGCSRETRIAALRRFPDLVKVMNSEGKQAIEAIDDAKGFVSK